MPQNPNPNRPRMKAVPSWKVWITDVLEKLNPSEQPIIQLLGKLSSNIPNLGPKEGWNDYTPEQRAKLNGLGVRNTIRFDPSGSLNVAGINKTLGTYRMVPKELEKSFVERHLERLPWRDNPIVSEQVADVIKKYPYAAAHTANINIKPGNVARGQQFPMYTNFNEYKKQIDLAKIHGLNNYEDYSTILPSRLINIYPDEIAKSLRYDLNWNKIGHKLPRSSIGATTRHELDHTLQRMSPEGYKPSFWKSSGPSLRWNSPGEISARLSNLKSSGMLGKGNPWIQEANNNYKLAQNNGPYFGRFMKNEYTDSLKELARIHKFKTPEWDNLSEQFIIPKGVFPTSQGGLGLSWQAIQ